MTNRKADSGEMRMMVVATQRSFIDGYNEVVFQGRENNRIVVSVGHDEWVVGMEADITWAIKRREPK